MTQQKAPIETVCQWVLDCLSRRPGFTAGQIAKEIGQSEITVITSLMLLEFDGRVVYQGEKCERKK